MTDVFDELVAMLQHGDRAALATLISRRGSAPGALGSKMLVREDGSTLGSVGGGCVEAEVWQAAVDSFRTGVSEVLSFRLNAREAAESGLICGGSIRILIEPIGTEELDIFEKVASAHRRGEPAVLVTVLPPSPLQGRRAFLVRAEAASGCADGELGTLAAEALAGPRCGGLRLIDTELEGSQQQVVLEFLARPKTLLVLGAGHLSKEVVPLAKHVGFRVVVVDDRPVFANSEVFPDADEVHVAEFAEALERFPADADTFVLIVTRGHLHDELLLERAVGSPAGYVGMIGSRVKIATLFARLRARGITDEQLRSVHAPVGVDIGARLPEEIAVSIVAELIEIRNAER